MGVIRVISLSLLVGIALVEQLAGLIAGVIPSPTLDLIASVAICVVFSTAFLGSNYEVRRLR